jgi:hypothetical protein
MRHAARSTRWLALLVVAIVAMMAALPAAAQNTAPLDTPETGASILFPPPVYTLSGEFPIIGTADVPNMANYFIEFRPIQLPSTVTSVPGAPTATPTTPPVFFPAVLPASTPVTDGLLGEWDTTLVPDGLYEIRLTVNVTGGSPVVTTVGPLRVQNTPDETVAAVLAELGITLGGVGTGAPAAEPTTAPSLPTSTPAPTIQPTEDPTPRGTVTTATANVRTGDGTNYPAILSLPQDTVVTLVGISNQGTGWYQVQTPDGRLGWMSPTVIAISGNTSLLPRVQPPPPPATPTFTPIPATPTPATSTNLVAGIIVLNPAPPNCNQTFNVGVDIANLGSQANAVTGFFSVTVTHVASGTVTGSTQGPVPIIQPGQTIRVDNIPLTVSTFFNEEHRITITIDSANQIPETNKGDNSNSTTFVLQRAGC